MNYSNRELADIHFYYGLAGGSGVGAQRLYAEAFPRRRVPDRRTFIHVHQRLSETGRFLPFRGNAGRPIQENRDDIADRILERVQNDPRISIRRLVAEFDVPYATIWRILHGAELYPYHLQRVQVLEPQDYQARLGFCQWFLGQHHDFRWNVLFTDEAQFTRDGINNFHNQHNWAINNPHGIVEANNQHRFSLNVWAGIIGEFFFGPVFLPPRLDGPAYREFLLNTLPLLMEDVPIQTRRVMWFMHDGAPAHFSLAAREVLNRANYFRNRWIGRRGPINWPARSPDMNPLDFFLWGHCKALVYAQPINTIDELRQSIENAFQDIRATPGIFQRVNLSLHRRMEACILVNGGHFEQLI